MLDIVFPQGLSILSLFKSHSGRTPVPFPTWPQYQRTTYPLITVKSEVALTQSEVLERLGKFWFDTALSSGPQTWGALSQIAKPTQIVFGSDWPFANAGVVREELKGFTQPGSVPAELRADVMRDNAKRLFPNR